MRRIPVIDPLDRRVDDFRDLKRADRRPDRPGGRGLVIAEGTVVVRRLVESAYPIRALLGVPRRYEELRGDPSPEVGGGLGDLGFGGGAGSGGPGSGGPGSGGAGSGGLSRLDVPFFVAEAEVMADIVGFHLNRGVIAIADRAAFPPAEALLAAARRVAVLEGVVDHENMGAIFRNAAALGIDAVLVGAGCADPLYRRSVRVSMGNVLAVPFAPLPALADGGAGVLRAAGFRIVALTPRYDAIPLAALARSAADGAAGSAGAGAGAAGSGGDRLAIVLGSEGPGLSDEALRSADVLARIEMARGVDSLNVATAGAIAFAALCPASLRPGPAQLPAGAP